MNVVEYNNLIDKLSLQVKSFQEGFSLLSNAATLKELGTDFCRILQGNFFIRDVNIFFKKNATHEWECIIVHNEKCMEYLPYLKATHEAHIEYFNDTEFCVTATLPLTDGAMWGLVIGNKIDKSEITEIDKITLQMFLQLLDNAYQSFINQKKEKQLIFSLNHRVVQLNSLIDTGIEISKLHKTSSLLELSLERAAALTNASRGVLRIIADDGIATEIGFPGNSDILHVLSSEQRIDTGVEFKHVKYLYSLSEKESRNGIIDFDQTDEILLQAFARQVLAALENEHLHTEAIDKERMHQEIEMAATIQRKIIPQQLPQIEDYDLAGINIPSLEIGGDYYDVTKLKDGRYLLIIADVAGKGVASGLLVNTLNASLNAYVENDFQLTEVAERLNKIIFNASTPEKYITGFIALLEPESGIIEYLNAGHNPIFYADNGKLVKLDKGGLAFGMLDFSFPYESTRIQLKPGEKILFYTDGITEAMNHDDEEYTDQRLEYFFLSENSVSAETFIENLLADIKAHTKNTPQSDDITALYLSRNK
ncbi:MAG: PP2C family protein-serine/threonine phosphatase [Ignavibacteriaceae bacterium]|jgi:sigma-B regulation protein RsbU (phosphoserine phosphatase)